jgi:hypothetical protein
MMQKSAYLDRDKSIPLNAEVAEQFASEMGAILAFDRLNAFLSEQHRDVVAKLISDLPRFPFEATLSNGEISLTYRSNEAILPPVSK